MFQISLAFCTQLIDLMRTILLVLACVIFTASLPAQFKTIATGPVFEEPETGFSKILLLKNTNTVFFNITLKNGIAVKIYGADHKQKN